VYDARGDGLTNVGKGGVLKGSKVLLDGLKKQGLLDDYTLDTSEYDENEWKQVSLSFPRSFSLVCVCARTLSCFNFSIPMYVAVWVRKIHAYVYVYVCVRVHVRVYLHACLRVLFMCVCVCEGCVSVYMYMHTDMYVL